MKKVVAILLAVVLVAGGLGGFAYVKTNSLEPMTGQKLVGHGAYGVFPPEEDGTYLEVAGSFTVTNPDCVSEITIDRISIFDFYGKVVYEGDLFSVDWEDGELVATYWTEPLKPHEQRWIEVDSTMCYLRDQGYWEGDHIFFTVEIFWSGAKRGLPLIGWSWEEMEKLDDAGNMIESVSGSMTQMVNMEQVLKPEKPKKVYNIGITQWVTLPGLDAVRHGFIDQMAEEGFIEGVNVEYDFRNAEEDVTEAERIAEEFVREKVDLILSITTPSSQACVEAAKGTKIPVVFAAVTAPVVSGIVSTWDAPRPDNVTGVSDFPDLKAQMELLKEILPEAKVLGVIYNPGGVYSLLDELKDIMADVGIEDIVEATVATPEEVCEAAMSLVGRCDAMIGDYTVFQAVESVVVVAEENKLPLFGYSYLMVEAGCIASHAVDYTWEGEEAGRYAARILRGEFAGDIPVGRCSGENLVLVVNPAAALRMGVTIPEEIIVAADIVYGEEVYNIGVTQIVTHPDLDAVRQGFTDQMAEEGFVEGVDVEYDYCNPEMDLTEAERIAEYFVFENVDLIASITTPSTQACVEAAKGTKIPVVFAAVTSPVLSGIVSTWDAPRPDNVTGVSDFPDIKAQMELLKEILPEATVLGVIYNPGEFWSIPQIDRLKEIVADVGIEDIVEATVATPEDVYDAAMSLVGECHAIWIPEDGTVSSALESLVVVAEEYQLPFFGSGQDMVDRGCIATEAVDYTWVGEEAGRYAARILKGEFAGDIPVGRCSGENLLLVVNPGAAERMGVTIPEEVLDRADRIVGE